MNIMHLIEAYVLDRITLDRVECLRSARVGSRNIPGISEDQVAAVREKCLKSYENLKVALQEIKEKLNAKIP